MRSIQIRKKTIIYTNKKNITEMRRNTCGGNRQRSPPSIIRVHGYKISSPKRSLLTFISDGSVKIKVNFFVDIFTEEKIGELIDLVREFIDPVVMENISDERMKRNSFNVDPIMFRDGYDGIKKMILRLSDPSI